jgi:hypothetical protein
MGNDQWAKGKSELTFGNKLQVAGERSNRRTGRPEDRLTGIRADRQTG